MAKSAANKISDKKASSASSEASVITQNKFAVVTRTTSDTNCRRLILVQNLEAAASVDRSCGARPPLLSIVRCSRRSVAQLKELPSCPPLRHIV
jgi:hypothetical protein